MTYLIGTSTIDVRVPSVYLYDPGSTTPPLDVAVTTEQTTPVNFPAPWVEVR